MLAYLPLQQFYFRHATAVAMQALAVLCIIILSACGPDEHYPAPYGDETTGSIPEGAQQKIYSSISVYANDIDWTSAGVTLEENERFTIRTIGDINLCSNSTETGLLNPRKTSIWGTDPWSSGGWYNTGYRVENGTYYLMNVLGQYSTFPFAENDEGDLVATCPQDTKFWNNDCYSTAGKGLFVYIGDSPPSSSTIWSSGVAVNAGIEDNTLDTDGDGNDTGSYSFHIINQDGYTTNNFFELYDYRKSGAPSSWHQVFGGMIIRPNYSGNVWVHYAEHRGYQHNTKTNHAEIIAANQATDGRDWDDNTEGYSFKIKELCTHFNGQYLQARIETDEACTISSNMRTADGFTLEDAAQCEADADDPIFNVSFYQEHKKRISVVSPAKGRLLFRIVDPDNEYSRNSGFYKVNLEVLSNSLRVSALLNELILPIKETLFGERYGRVSLTQQMYHKLVPAGDFTATVDETNAEREEQGLPVLLNPPNFINIVRALLTLYIVLFVFFYFMGMVQEPQTEFIYTVIRFGIIITLISPGSWEFFNTYLFALFVGHAEYEPATGNFIITGGLHDLIAMVSQGFVELTNVSEQVAAEQTDTDLGASGLVYTLNANDPFEFINASFTVFFSEDAWKRMSSLIFSHPAGVIFFLLMICGMVMYAYVILYAAILYLIALIALSFLIGLAPIFITLMLFKYTRGYFSGWIAALLNYSFQPVLLFAMLSLFNALIISAFKVMINIPMDFTCIAHWQVTDSFDICFFKFFQTTSDFALDSASVLPIFAALIYTMYKMCDWVVTVAASITTEGASASLSKITKGTMADAGQKAATTARIGGAVGGSAAKTAGKAVRAQAKGLKFISDKAGLTKAVNRGKTNAGHKMRSLQRKTGMGYSESMMEQKNAVTNAEALLKKAGYKNAKITKNGKPYKG